METQIGWYHGHLPEFLKGVNILIQQDYSLSLDHWARFITAGPANETDQRLTFHTTAVPVTLFVNPPQVSSTGTLTMKTSDTQSGIATVSVYLMDNGSENNTSATETFYITIKPSTAPQISEIEDTEISQDSRLGGCSFEAETRTPP